MTTSPSFLNALNNLLGPKGFLQSAEDKAPFLHEWRGRLTGESAAILLPASTGEVAEIVKLCAAHQTPLVPQGGNTGLVGASVPLKEHDSLLLSLKRMNHVRSMDAADFSMVAEAGCTLAFVQETASEANRFIGMTLASEGSATVGGLIATNAGGSMTLRYGNMREQVLGLEVVLADGSIWDGLRKLRKNNSGYDIRQNFISSEGTLGIITAACLKLYPKPATRETAIIAFDNLPQAIAAFVRLREATQDLLAAFELMPEIAVRSAVAHIPNQRAPFTKNHPWMALIETHASGTREAPMLPAILERLLEKAEITDAVLAEKHGDAEAFWHLRETIVEAQRHLGASLKHDIAVPISQMARFIAEAQKLTQQLIPGARPYAFGHVGDGNVHFNISQPEAMAADAFTAQREKMAQQLNDLAISLGGSISAEHGIGRFRRDEFYRTVAAEELRMMQKIKCTLDPQNLFNPGVIFKG